MSKHDEQIKGFPQYHLPGFFNQLEIAEADRIAPAHQRMIRGFLQCFDLNLSPKEVARLRKSQNRGLDQHNS